MSDSRDEVRTVRRIAGRLAALDPGLARWRVAWAATVSLAVTLLVEFLLAGLVFPGQSALTVMLVGGVGAMQGSAAVLQPTVGARLRFGLAQPAVAIVGVSLAVLLHAAAGQPIELAAFVVVTFCAVVIRRFGAAFAVLGLVGWTGYYMAMILRPPVPRLPMLMWAELVAGVCTIVLSITVFRHRPRASLRHALSGWHARAELVFGAAADLLENPGRRTGLDRRYSRLSDVALTVEGWLAVPASPKSAGHAQFVRERLLRSEAAIDVIVESVRGLTGPAKDVVALLRLLARGCDEAAAVAARRLESSPHERRRRLAAAVLAYVRAGRGWHEYDDDLGAAEFTPVVAVAPAGALPGTAGVAAAAGRSLGLPMRQAIQTAVSVGLSIVLGLLVSPTQYYWSLIAVFIVLLGPATRAETVLRGLHRTVGTLLGCLVAVPVTAVLHGNVALVLCLVLASCLLGQYVMSFSYGVLAFLITVCVFQLYDVMHSYEPALVPVRLAETALGAGIAMVVAAVVLPVRARDAAQVAQDRLSRAVSELREELDRAARGRSAGGAVLRLSRAVDEHRRVHALAHRPLWTKTDRGLPARYAALATHTRGLALLAHDESGPAVLSGTVSSSGGSPVFGATVTVIQPGTGAAAIGHADLDGRYRLEPEEAGTQLVVVTAPGCAALATWLFLRPGRDTEADFVLSSLVRSH